MMNSRAFEAWSKISFGHDAAAQKQRLVFSNRFRSRQLVGTLLKQFAVRRLVEQEEWIEITNEDDHKISK